MGVGMIELFLLLPIIFGANSGFGIPLAMPPGEEDPMMSNVAPEKVIFYSTWAGTKKPDPSANPTEKWLAQKGIQDCIEKIRMVVLKAIESWDSSPLSKEERNAVLASVQLVEIALKSPGTFYLSDANLPIDEFFGPAFGRDRVEPHVSGALIFAPGDQKAEFTKLLSGLEDFMKSDESVRQVEIRNQKFLQAEVSNLPFKNLTWGFVGEYFVMGLGENSIENAIDNMKTPPPSWLNDLRSTAGIERIATISIIDFERYLELNGEEADPMLVNVFRELGITDTKNINWITGLDQQGFIVKTNVQIKGEPKGLYKILDGEPLPKHLLHRIPSDHTVAFASRFSAKEIYELIRQFFGTVESTEEFDNTVIAFEEMSGIQVKRDLVDALAGTIYLYGNVEIDRPVEGWILSFGLENEMTFGPTIKRLTKVLEESTGESMDVTEADGYEIYSFNPGPFFFGIEPSWAVGDREFLISLTSGSLKSHLKREKLAEDSLAGSKWLNGLLSENESRPIGVATLNVSKLLTEIYPLFMDEFADYLIEEMEREGIEMTKADLPTLEMLTNGVNPSVAALYRTKNGFQLIQRQTYPGGSAGTTIGGLASAGTMMSLSTAGQAKKLDNANRLRQITIALHNYHDAYKALPAAYNVNHEGNPLLSWRVHILPFIGEKELYDRFKLDEPWDSDHNKKLIAQMPDCYAFPGGKEAKKGKTRYLGNATEDGVFKKPRDHRSMKGFTLESISNQDGTSNTICLINVKASKAIEWTKPEDLESLPAMDPASIFETRFRSGFHVSLADASVHFIPLNVDVKNLTLLFSKNDGEVVDVYDLVYGKTRFDDSVDKSERKDADRKEDKTFDKDKFFEPELIKN